MTATAVAVRERPILFSGPMVRAILSGQKTQTRRVVSDRVLDRVMPHPHPAFFLDLPDYSPYGKAGDRLWVREAFAGPDHIGDGDQGVVGFGIEYKADGKFRAHGDCGCEGPCGGVLIVHPWKPSIHMPRWASRLSLELTGVRVERLLDITDSDAIAEGLEESVGENSGEPVFGVDGVTAEREWNKVPRKAFAVLWDSINAKRGYGWDVNPWVWVLSFQRVL
jgi:hypothetical protein